MAPATKAVRMERALEEASRAADEWRRLDYIAEAAKVSTAIKVRRAQRLGASIRAIETATDVPRATVHLICRGPEPTMPAKETA